MNQSLHPITTNRIDPEAAKVVRRLNRHGFEAYLVGGCVRDLLLGRTPKDFDVATNATPDEIRTVFRNCRIIGRRFRLAHVHFGSKIIETATFRTTPTPADGESMIWHDNEFGSAEDDAARRDFTINGLFYDLSSGKVIDTVEGLADLRMGRIRTIGDPDVRFQEDPVRILRAVKFATRLAFTIEKHTHYAMVTHRGLIAECSIARVLEEIYRLLRGGTAREAFRTMHDLGILAVLFPEIAAVLQPPTDPRACEPVPAVRAGHPKRRSRVYPPTSKDARASSGDMANEVAPLPEEITPPPQETMPFPDLTPGPSPTPRNGDASVPGAHADPASPSAPTSTGQLLAELDLEHAGALEEVERQLWAHLDALDRLVRRSETPPSEPVLLGALLGPLAKSVLRDDHKMGVTIEAIRTLVTTIASRIHASRRHRERLQQILVAQRRLARARPRPGLRQRNYFAEARLLLGLRMDALGIEGPTPPDSPPSGRRRRRRRRRSKTGSNAATSLPESAPAPPYSAAQTD